MQCNFQIHGKCICMTHYFAFIIFVKLVVKKNKKKKRRKKKDVLPGSKITQKNLSLQHLQKHNQYVNFTQVSEICPLTSLFLLLLPSFLKEPCMCSAIHLTLTSNIPVSMTSCVRRRLHGTSHTTCR